MPLSYILLLCIQLCKGGVIMASVVFCPGATTGRNELSIFLTNSDGQRQDAYAISYAIFDNTTGTELLIGDASRVPENPEIGEYYANFRIPDFAPYGDYVVRWTFTQFAGGPSHQVAQEFGVVPEGTQVSASSAYTAKQWSLMHSLRMMLRDNCVGEEETILLDVDGEVMEVRMDTLYEALNG